MAITCTRGPSHVPEAEAIQNAVVVEIAGVVKLKFGPEVEVAKATPPVCAAKRRISVPGCAPICAVKVRVPVPQRLKFGCATKGALEPPETFTVTGMRALEQLAPKCAANQKVVVVETEGVVMLKFGPALATETTFPPTAAS